MFMKEVFLSFFVGRSLVPPRAFVAKQGSLMNGFVFWTVAIRPCTSSEIEHHGLYILLAGAAMMKQSEMNVGLTHIHFV